MSPAPPHHLFIMCIPTCTHISPPDLQHDSFIFPMYSLIHLFLKQTLMKHLLMLNFGLGPAPEILKIYKW